jgi:hypothetical protein
MFGYNVRISDPPSVQFHTGRVRFVNNHSHNNVANTSISFIPDLILYLSCVIQPFLFFLPF